MPAPSPADGRVAGVGDQAVRRAAQVRRMRTWWAAALERLRAQVEAGD
jgi:hypothetical protein